MRLTNEVRQRLLELPGGNIADSNPTGGVMDAGIKPIDPAWKMIGRAATVRCAPGDNLALHRAIARAEAGEVLVFSCAGFCGAGHFGDMMAHACQARGVAGVVIDGACRDGEDLRRLGLPVFARALSPAPTSKSHLGELGVPVIAGGVVVRPGDVVFGDCDGVIVVPREAEDEVFERALAKHERERHVLEELAGGRTTLEVYGLDALVERLSAR